jgi:hypothetical protein
MRLISELFLRAKAFPLFGIAVVLFVSLATSPAAAEGPTRATLGGLALSSFLMGLLPAFFLGWLWSVGALLNSIVLPGFRHNQKWFSYAAIALITVFVLLPWALNGGATSIVAKVVTVLLLLSAPIAYLEQRSVAKAAFVAETGRAPTYWEYMNVFFTIGFWFIGIWSLQPKINRWYEENKNEFMRSGPGAE